MLVLVRLAFVRRMLVLVMFVIRSMLMLMAMNMLVRMAVFEIAVPVFMVVRVGVLVFMFHVASVQNSLGSE